VIDLVAYILVAFAAGTAGLITLALLLRSPEIAFALFIFSYVIEGGDLIPGGLDLTPVFLFISLVGFFLPTLKGKPVRFTPKSSDLWLFLFLLILFGGSYLAPDIQGAIQKAFLFTVAVFLPYMITRLFFKTYKQIWIFLTVICGLATGIAAILTVISFSHKYAGGRLQFFEANPIPTGTLLALGLVIAVIGLTSELFGKTRKVKLLCIVAILVCLYGIFLSGVRGPLISAIVGLALYFLVLFMQRPRVLASIAGMVVLVLVTFNVWYRYVISSVPNIGGYSLQAITEGLSTQERVERYRAAIELFVQNPLLGTGTDGFAQHTGLGYPHNIFLEIASETGVVGLLIFTCFLASIALHGLRYFAMSATRYDPRAMPIGLAVLVVSLTLLMSKQFSYNLTMHKDLFAFLGLMANLPLLTRFNS
jgi:O-antigen ligase